MKCPACQTTLTSTEAGSITVDICKTGCGGIWFDKSELQRLDDADESAGEGLLKVEKNASIKIDVSKKKKCPKCDNVVMVQHFYSAKHKVTVDECYGCNGFWLDPGELGAIRNEYKSEKERNAAFDQYFSAIFDPLLAEERLKDQQQLEKDKKFAPMFRYICPSYYIPGKQSWGAF